MRDQDHDERLGSFLSQLKGHAWPLRPLDSHRLETVVEGLPGERSFDQAFRHEIFDLIESSLLLRTASDGRVFREAAELRETLGMLIVERAVSRIISVTHRLQDITEPWRQLHEVRSDFKLAIARLSVADALGAVVAKKKIVEIHHLSLYVEAQLLLARGVDRANRAFEIFSRAAMPVAAPSKLSPLAEQEPPRRDPDLAGILNDELLIALDDLEASKRAAVDLLNSTAASEQCEARELLTRITENLSVIRRALADLEELMAIFNAVERDDVAMIARCLEINPSLVLVTARRYSLTLLHIAARHGRQAVSELLLGRGATLDATDGEGATPLLYAARADHADLAVSLLKRGGNPNACDNEKRSVLWWAVENGLLQLVEPLLAAGASVNGSDKNLETVLHRAAHNGDAKMAKLLLENGANVNAERYDGLTPLDFARKQVVDLLRHSGGRSGRTDARSVE